jgi:hypothetical protein
MVIRLYSILNSIASSILLKDTGAQQKDGQERTFQGLERIVPEALDRIPLDQMRRFSRKSWRFISAYSHGLTGLAADYAVKKYKSHRRIPDSVVDDPDVLEKLHQ